MSQCSWETRDHSPGRCATFGIGGRRADGDVLNKPDNRVAQHLSEGAAAKLQTTCPLLSDAHGGASGEYCCTEQQIQTIEQQVYRLAITGLC